MNKAEAAELLAIAGAFDRWIRVDDLTATAWHYALADVPGELGKQAVLEHYKGADAHKSLMPADIIKAVEVRARLTRPQVEADVRTAKAYGLIEQSWPDAELLPELVRQRLQDVRDGKRREALEQGDPEHIAPAEYRELEKRLGGAAA